MRTYNDINRELDRQVDYYENNKDYSDQYLDLLGDQLQYEDRFNEDEILAILDSELTTETDYSYLADNCITLFHMGEIEVQIDTNLTKKEFNAIEDKLDYPASWNEGYIIAYICSGMNVRVYSSLSLTVEV